jgi:Coenzyme PQQ synthesis protein D (PqqD)
MIDRNVEAPLRQNPDVVARRLDNTAVLVNIATNRIFELNETGAKVWELLGEGVDTDGIVRRLVDEFDVEERQAADEVKNLIVQLQTEGLLVR